MTDRIAALATLNATAAPERIPALAAFRERYTSDPLVLDKWLALEATAPVDGAVLRVKELMRDSGVSFDNPNRMRALIGSFASANQNSVQPLRRRRL